MVLDVIWGPWTALGKSEWKSDGLSPPTSFRPGLLGLTAKFSSQALVPATGTRNRSWATVWIALFSTGQSKASMISSWTDR